MSQRDSGPSQQPERVVSFARATLRSVDFRKVRFDSFALSGCLFLSCDFRGMRLDRRWQPLFSALPASTFRDCSFDLADLRGVRPDVARFERCTFDDARLDGWRTEASQFVECRFAGALRDVTFHGRPVGAAGRRVATRRARNEFAANDFRDAELEDVVFVGVDLDAQRLPVGDRYVRLGRFRQRVARARVEIAAWPDRDERRAAAAMLRALAARWREQDEIIAVRVDRASGIPERVQWRVWDVLERATSPT